MIIKLLSILLGFQHKLLNLLYPMNGINSELCNPRMSKTFFTANMTLEINSKTKQKSKLVSENAKKILKKYVNKPDELLQFIESRGTKVIKAPYMDKVLGFIGEDEGFITPAKGLKALFLITAINILSKQKLPYSFKTSEMFVMRDLPVNIFSLAHQLHHWMAFRQNLPGYEAGTVQKFKNIWQIDKTPGEIEKLSINDVISLRNAIARDIEAIEFVKAFTREYIGSKDSLDKIKEGQRVNI